MVCDVISKFEDIISVNQIKIMFCSLQICVRAYFVFMHGYWNVYYISVITNTRPAFPAACTMMKASPTAARLARTSSYKLHSVSQVRGWPGYC